MENLLLRGAPFLLAFAFTAGLTAAAIRICYEHGWTARPRPDRWHSGTPAFFGGVPIFLGFLAATTIFLRTGQLGLWKLIAACSLIFLLGLADDVWHLRARSKLVAQSAVAALLLLSGISYPLSGNATVNFCFSLLW